MVQGFVHQPSWIPGAIPLRKGMSLYAVWLMQDEQCDINGNTYMGQGMLKTWVKIGPLHKYTSIYFYIYIYIYIYIYVGASEN